jgi:hypothetical protein
MARRNAGDKNQSLEAAGADNRQMVGCISIRPEILNEASGRIDSLVINAELLGNDPPHLQRNLRIGSLTATREELIIRNRREPIIKINSLAPINNHSNYEDTENGKYKQGSLNHHQNSHQGDQNRRTKSLESQSILADTKQLAESFGKRKAPRPSTRSMISWAVGRMILTLQRENQVERQDSDPDRDVLLLAVATDVERECAAGLRAPDCRDGRTEFLRR